MKPGCKLQCVLLCTMCMLHVVRSQRTSVLGGHCPAVSELSDSEDLGELRCLVLQLTQQVHRQQTSQL